MLKEIALVTIVVSNLAQVETAWTDFFGYQVSDRGTVSNELADYWDANDMEDLHYAIMQPANNAPVYLRFVEDPTAAGYRPMTSYGWNATELLVRDTDAVAASLAESPFTIVGAPKNLWPAPDAPRAMQAMGPSGELIYLTTNTQAAGALGLNDEMPLVERAFIMVLGGPSMSELTEFYGGTLGLRVDPPSFFKITMISKANNLDIETVYPLAIAYTAPGNLIELDELPETVSARPVEDSHLPPGVAIVAFNSNGIDADVDWQTEPRAIDEFPYNGRRAGILRGPAGELVEVIMAEDN